MHPALIPSLAVATIYYLWRGYQAYLARRDRQLRNRVAFLLWSAAQRCV